MEVAVAIGLALALFAAMVLAGAPIAVGLLGGGAAGLIALRGLDYAEVILGVQPYSATASYFLILVPLYILMGMFVSNGGLAGDIYRVSHHLLRRVPGGVGLATIASCAGFAAVTGSSIAAVATIGRVAIDEMQKYGYPSSLAAGIVAAGGTLGALIPPSIALVIIGIITGESIGALLVAGIIPGIMVTLLYGGYISWATRSFDDGELVQSGHRGALRLNPSAHTSKLSALRETREAPETDGASIEDSGRIPYEAVVYVLVLVTIVVGGLYTGYFTVIEGGAIATVVAAVLMGGRVLFRGQSLKALIKDSLLDTQAITSMVFALLIGGAVFTHFLVVARAPTNLASWVSSIPLPPLLIVVAILVMLVPLGMLLDPLSIVLVFLPIVYPVVTGLGYDGIWFGIVFLRMMEVAMITPPVGLNVYVVTGVATDVTVEEAFRGSAPFVAVDILSIAVLIAFPGLVTWLPNMIIG